MIYPYTTPQVMTDIIFQSFGGTLGDTLPEMRELAYAIAEQLICEDMETFLVPTAVTGTYNYSPSMVSLKLDHAFVRSVGDLSFLDVDGRPQGSTDSRHITILGDGTYGIISFYPGVCQCQFLPGKVVVPYVTGLPDGSTDQAPFRMALMMLSRIMLNEMIGFGNEAPGDIGVQRYSNQSYSETRVGLLRTVYGTSAQAQLIHKLLAPYRKYRESGL